MASKAIMGRNGNHDHAARGVAGTGAPNATAPGTVDIGSLARSTMRRFPKTMARLAE